MFVWHCTNDGFGHDFERKFTPIKVLVMNKSIDLQLQGPMQNMHLSFNCKQENQKRTSVFGFMNNYVGFRFSIESLEIVIFIGSNVVRKRLRNNAVFHLVSHFEECSLGVVIINLRLALLHTTSDDQFLFLFSIVPMYGFQ